MTRLILLPGLASNEALWRAQREALAPWSPHVTDVHTREDSIPAMAAALLREHAGPLVLCGASMGGMIAMEAARQAPERIAGLALLGTDARPDSPMMIALRTNAITTFAQGRVREVIEPNIAFAFHPDHAQALAGSYLDFVLAAGADQLIRQNRAVIARPDARVHLPQVRHPVLVMCGDTDQLTPPERSQEIAALIPQARLVMVPRCGHMLTMERPDVVNAVLVEWLSTVIPAVQDSPPR
ncbi:alpha/beta fold hydrolase [Ramlibacter sp. PS3R-8]|uniref:alpha/beta fold hydrolase n=1 Tax=Ramlibacter sp. PS3R-8 TaxID=3133437 RepID=UPI003097F2D3